MHKPSQACARLLCGGLLAALLLPAPRAGAEEIALTVYQDDLALVRHRRDFDLSAGENRISVDQLSDRLQVDSVLLRHAENPAYLNVLELVYRNRAVTPQSLLEAYVGRSVGILRTHPLSDADTRIEAELLSVADSPVFRIDGRIESAPPGRIVFDELPPKLTLSPQLDVRVVSQDSGRQPVAISYLSQGFGWQADYVAELDGEDSLSLDVWAAVENRTNADFRQASIQLVSGRINRAEPQPRQAPAMESARMLAADAGGATPARETLGQVQLYRLPRTASLGAGETRRIALHSARQVPVDNLYTLSSQTPRLYQSRFGGAEQRLPIQRQIRIHNRLAHNLGQPLPAGIVRLYQADSQGDPQLVGEDRVEHIAVDQSILLTLGEAVELSARKTQLSFRKLPAEAPYRNVYGSEYRIRLSNSRDTAVNVIVSESLPGDWRIDGENLPHERRSAAEAVWTVTVPAQGETELRYSAIVQF